MSSKEFRQACIPVELADTVVAFIRRHPEFGHRSFSDFMRVAAMDRLRLLETHLAMRTVCTSPLGVEAFENMLRYSIPADPHDMLVRIRREERLQREARGLL